MKNYLRNLGLFIAGFRWLFTRRWPSDRTKDQPFDPARHVWYADGWGPWKYLLLVYWWDCLLTALVAAGPVEPLSSFMHRHRGGWLNDKVLDVIETWDPGHGATSGPALWGSVESPRWVRYLAPAVWVPVIAWLVWKLIGAVT